MMKKSLLPMFILVSWLIAEGAVPVNYYRSVSGRKDADLKTALHTLLYNHTEVSSYSNLPDYFRRTDVYPRGDSRYGQWWDMYGNIPLYLPSFWGLNREHSLPKSWWGGSTDTPAYVDLNHLYPSESEANMAKSNYPLGEVSSNGVKFANGVSTVGYPVSGQGGGAAQVFEPDDEYKGDFARTYFYMACCYQNLQWKYTYMFSNNTYPTLNSYSIELLMRWHRNDPVSQKELDRNEQVYLIQANRNPFIDYPELAEYLWGNKTGQLWFPGTVEEPTGTPDLITPVQGMDLQFGQTAIGSSNTAALFFQGENLTGTLSLKIYKGDTSQFTLDTQKIAAANVNSQSGYWLRVTYQPTELGEHTARLLISDGGIDGSRAVELRGECLPVPELHSFKALAAENITSNSYVARWEAPAYAGVDDVVDYYVVTRTVYNSGKAESEDIEAEDTHIEITGCTPGSRESYNVRSCRLGYFSERSNEIYVNLENAGIDDVATDDLPLGWAAIEGGVRLVCGGMAHPDLRVYDSLGRLVRMEPEISNNYELLLPTGVYLITTGRQPRPLRVLVR